MGLTNHERGSTICRLVLFAPFVATKLTALERDHMLHRMSGQTNITELLAGYGRGDKEALDQLMPIVYGSS
jgi:hypothetical protein